MERSTRLSIVEHALTDVTERLEELPPRDDTNALRRLAQQYAGELERWRETPPEEARRTELLKSVLDLNMEVMRAGGRPHGSAASHDDSDADDDSPRPL